MSDRQLLAWTDMNHPGWCLTLTDGREYLWHALDGVHSEADALKRLAVEAPGGVVAGIEAIRVMSVADIHS